MAAAQIEKGVPLPSNRAEHGKYPFKDMSVGDSFVIPESAVRAGLYSIASRRGIKITIRKVGEAELRVWRIA